MFGRNGAVCAVGLWVALAVSLGAWGDLADRLFSTKPAEQSAAEAEFEKLDQAGKVALIPRLVDGLESESSARTARYLLKKMGDAAVPAAKALLASPDARVRSRGIELMAELKTGESAPILNGVAKSDPDENCRWDALSSLIVKNKVPADMVPALVEALGHRQRATMACRALQKLGAPAEASIPALARLLDGAPLTAVEASEALNQSAAMEALASFGDKAKGPVPAMVALLGSDDLSVRVTAADSLAKIGAAAESEVIAAVDSPNVPRREMAMRALSKMRPYSEAAAAVFVKRASDENVSVRNAARTALREMGSDAARKALALAEEKDKAAPSEGKDNVTISEDGVFAGKGEGRIRTKAEVIAANPSDANHGHPRELQSGFAVTGLKGEEFFVTIHAGQDWASRVAIWAKEKDGYWLLWNVERGAGYSGGRFAAVTPLRYHGESLLHIPWFEPGTGHCRKDFVFALGGPRKLEPIYVEYAAQWYKDKLKKGEGVWKGEDLTFSDERLAFEFLIWNEKDSNSSPTAGRVTGTFKLVRSPEQPTRLVVDKAVRGDIEELK